MLISVKLISVALTVTNNSFMITPRARIGVFTGDFPM